MSVTPADLERSWSRLSDAGRSTRRFTSIRIDEAGPLNVHAALRAADAAPCLLFDLIDPAQATSVEFEVSGMRLHRSLAEEGQILVLSLEDTSKRDLFATICADVISATSGAPTTRGLQHALERLDAWRLFLRTLTGGMGRSEVVGLLGELLVLRQLVERRPDLLTKWRSPDGGLHDFENMGHALEVKTTIGPGSRIHISTLDQLDMAGLERLDLLHVRLFESEAGECIDEIVRSIQDQLLPDAIREFANALLRRGLRPDDQSARSGLRVRLQQITAYAVTDGFPHFGRSDVPAEIVDAAYSLELGPLQSSAFSWAEGCTAYCERNS
jgi:hypothetical protein